MSRAVLAAMAVAAVAFHPSDAGAFKLLEGDGSHHERITRTALAEFQLGQRTLNALAGTGDLDLGAVGWPDVHHALSSRAHCDNGDYLASPPGPTDRRYPRSEAAARDRLQECRDRIVERIEMAVRAARPLADPNANNTATDCWFTGVSGRAKCNVLEHLGFAFHAAQDFYSHTNWVDSVSGDLGLRNPPGLNNEGRAPWLDPRQTVPFPEGLISGCFGACRYWQYVRVHHDNLNKDAGEISEAGVPGEPNADVSPRGANGNYSRAVLAAVDDTRDKWRYFEARVLQEYPETGARILCMIRNDDYRQC